MLRGPRQESCLRLTHLALITVAAFLIADITTLLIDTKMEAPLLMTAAALPQLENLELSPTPPVVLSSVVQSGVFGRHDPGPPLAGGFGEPLRPPTQPMNMRLIGTVVATDGNSFAILEDLVTKEQVLYRLNDHIREAGRIVQIERNRIGVSRGGSLERLELTLEEPASLKPAEQVAAIDRGDPRGLILDRREMRAGYDNLASLMTKARVSPHLTKGKPDGFLIQDIVPGSLFERIGLRNNDILRRINGVEVQDPETLFKMLFALKDETSIALDLVRGGRLETYAYEIR